MGLIRLFLAVVVAADHWRIRTLFERGIHLEDYWKLGFNAGYAVMFFYIISGFLITYTLERNYRLKPAGIAAFYRNRFIRIFSLYWPLLLLTFVLFPAAAWGAFTRSGVTDQLATIFLFGMDWRLAFAAQPGPYGLDQAWTLAAELTFYLVAPLLMRSWLIGAALLVASFTLRAYFVAENGTDLQEVWTYQFIGTTFGFFMLGHLACRFRRWLSNTELGLGALLASVICMGWAVSYASFDTPRFWGATTFFTLALPGVFEATKDVRWMNLAGDLSYPLYLVHTIVLILLGPWIAVQALPVAHMAPMSAGYVSVAVFVAICIAAAAIVHQLIEVPTAWAMRTALQAPKTNRAPAE